MQQKWRILDFSLFKGDISYSQNTLFVSSDSNGKVTVPLSDVGVIIVGTHAHLSSGVLYGLSKNDCVLLVCDWRNNPVSAALPCTGHSRVAARQIAQAQMTLPKKKSAWAQIVRAKILGQANTLLALNNTEGEHLKTLAQQVRSGDPNNLEASAALFYWRRIFDEPFKRNSQSHDNRNSSLNYAYTILRGHVMRAVAAAGLVPTLGVFHRSRGNAFALADDLIEPFRPAIDYFVAKSFKENANFSPAEKECKHQLVSFCSEQFSNDGFTIPSAIQRLATDFGAYVEATERTRLNVNPWSGPWIKEDE